MSSFSFPIPRRSKRAIWISTRSINVDAAQIDDVAPGVNQSAALQAMIDDVYSKYGPNGFELIIDGVVKVNDLKIYSGMTVRGDGYRSGFVLVPGGTCAIRNANWRSSYNAAGNSVGNDTNGNSLVNDPFLLNDPFSAIIDRDICLRDFSIQGNRLNASGNTQTSGNWLLNLNYLKALPTGEYVVPLKFRGVRDLRVHNLNIFNTPMFHTHFANIDGGVFTDIHVHDDTHGAAPFNGPNTDGLHFEGPDRRLRIENIYGTTSDAFVAFLAESWNLFSPGDPSSLIGPNTMDGFSATYHGPITDVFVSNLNCTFSLGGVQLMSKADRIDRVVIRGINGTFAANPINITDDDITGYVANGSHGNIGHVIVEDMTGNLQGRTGSLGYVNVESAIEVLEFRSMHKPTIANTWDGFWFKGSAHIGHLIFNGLHVNETGASDVSGGPPDLILIYAGCIVDVLQLTNVTWTRNTQTPTDAALVRVDGTIGTAQLNNVRVDRVNHIFRNLTGSSVSEIQINNLRQTNGTSALYLYPSVVLPLLKAGGAVTTPRLYDTTASGAAITRIWDQSGNGYRNYAQNLSTVGYWRQGETSGTNAVDLMGTSNGTYTNGVTLNKPGALIERDDRAASYAAASSQYATIPHVSALTLGANWSISGWVKLASYTANEPAVLLKYGGGSNVNYGLDMTATGQPRFEMTIGNVFKQYNATAVVPLNTWSHLVATYDGAAAKVYVNGVLVVNQALSGTPDTNTSAPSIGRFGTANQGYMDGLIDEVTLHSRALTADEVATLYTLGSGRSA